MANENVPAPAPTKSDDQILPCAAWVPIGKRNHLDEDWFTLDEDWFTLDANLMREALDITPIDQARQFVLPPSGDAIMDFVNELGYPEAQISSSSDDLGIITNTNVDYVELMWEDFMQAMQTFLTDKTNLGSPTKKGRKDKPHVIPYCRFTKLIICYLERIHNIHQRSASPFHLAEEDLRLVASEKKGKKKSASTKQPKPKPAIEKSSKPALAPKPKVTKEKYSKASTAKPPKPKPAKEKATKATPLQKAGKGKVAKVRNMKSTFHLVDEPDEEPAYSEPEPEPEQEDAGEEYDMKRVIQMSLESFQAQGHAHVGEQAAQSLLSLHIPKRRSTTDQFILQRRTLTTDEASTGPSTQPLDDIFANIIRDSPSPADAETEEKTVEHDQDQAGSDPGETHESRPPPAQVLVDED
ncbi:hypothetical protein Tco_0646073 [Tanacetum coccineum]